MSRQKWILNARLCSTRHAQAAGDDPVGLALCRDPERSMLAELHKLVMEAPHNLLDIFRLTGEDEVAKASAPRLDEAAAGRFDWGPGSDDQSAWLMAAIAQVRALDEMLATAPRDGAMGPLMPQHWAVPDQDVFVVPRGSRRLDGTVPKKGEPYARRGLRFHAILPMEVRGFRIVPVALGVSPMPDQRLAFGAAMFRGAGLVPQSVPDETGRKRFLAASFEAEDISGCLDQQLASAFENGCFAVVWPELTVPPVTREMISGKLAMACLEHGDGALRIAVAGSWHERHDSGDLANVSHVLGRGGETLCTYVKHTVFHNPRWGEEAVERGEELSVVVAGDRLVGFAICKDFCDRATDTPYTDIPVDVMLVPSMGGAATMAGHVANAEGLRLRNGAIAFVVQHLSLEGEEKASSDAALGHVLLSTKGASPQPQAGIWSIHRTP